MEPVNYIPGHKVECMCGRVYEPPFDSRLYAASAAWVKKNPEQKGLFKAKVLDPKTHDVRCPMCLSRISELYFENLDYICRLVREKKFVSHTIFFKGWTISRLTSSNNGLFYYRSHDGHVYCMIRGRFECANGIIKEGFLYVSKREYESLLKETNLESQKLDRETVNPRYKFDDVKKFRWGPDN